MDRLQKGSSSTLLRWDMEKDCGLVLIAGGMYAGGFSGCLKQRMKQSLDVATFVEEFKDILVALLNAHFVLFLPARYWHC